MKVIMIIKKHNNDNDNNVIIVMTNGYWLSPTVEFFLKNTVKVYLAEHIF